VPPRTRAAVAEPGLATTWPSVLAWRLRRHHLVDLDAADLVPLVRRLSGVHAQLGSAAEAAIRLRSGGAIGPARVRAALAEQRTLVKTWAVRGTLHLLPAEDLPLWTAALGTRTFRRPKSWYAYHKVSEAEIAAIEETVPEVLSGRPITRERLAAEVARRTRNPRLEEQLLSGWGALLKLMAARGQLAFGPPAGGGPGREGPQRPSTAVVTFIDPRAWVADWADVEPEDAVAEVVRRYLDAYGPADLDELVGWSALDKPVLRRAVAALGGELVEVDTEGSRGWLTRRAAAEVAATVPSDIVRLLAGFDPYVVGALKQIAHLLSGPYRDRVSRTSGWISPVLVAGGTVVGTWTQEVRGGTLRVAVEPFEPLPDAVSAATEGEAQRWADVAGLPLALTWT
jgi:Winged helix DNA-binding domain